MVRRRRRRRSPTTKRRTASRRGVRTRAPTSPWQGRAPSCLRPVAAAGKGGDACCRISLRGQRGGEHYQERCRVLVGFRGQRVSLHRLRGSEALGQPLRESVGRRRRAAGQGGATAGRVFAREPEPLRGGGRRPVSPHPTTSRALGAPTWPWRGPGRPRREGVGRVPRLPPQDH